MLAWYEEPVVKNVMQDDAFDEISTVIELIFELEDMKMFDNASNRLYFIDDKGQENTIYLIQ